MTKEKIQEPSLALEILRDFKKQNQMFFIANTLLVVALIISIIF